MKKKACEEKKEEKGHQTVSQQGSQIHSPQRACLWQSRRNSTLSPQLTIKPERAPVWRRRHCSLFRVSHKNGKPLFPFAKRSPYKRVWGRERVNLVSLVGTFRSQFFLHSSFPLCRKSVSTKDYCPGLFHKKWSLIVILKAYSCTVRSIVTH